MRVLQDVQPAPEQLPILTASGSGFRLIRGARGLGLRIPVCHAPEVFE